MARKQLFQVLIGGTVVTNHLTEAQADAHAIQLRKEGRGAAYVEAMPKPAPKPLTAAQVKDAIGGVDQVTLKDGVYTARRTFYYEMGGSPDTVWYKIRTAFPNAVRVDGGTVRKPFRGGASIAASSHWWVKFTLA